MAQNLAISSNTKKIIKRKIYVVLHVNKHVKSSGRHEGIYPKWGLKITKNGLKEKAT